MIINLTTVIWMAIYGLAGYGFHIWARHYMKEMSAKVAEIDERFVKDIFITIPARSEREKDVLSCLMLACWPVVIIAVVIKAEREYNRIRHHVWSKGS